MPQAAGSSGASLEYHDSGLILLKVPPELGQVWTEACHKSFNASDGSAAGQVLASLSLRLQEAGAAGASNEQAAGPPKTVGSVSIGPDFREHGIASCNLVDTGGADDDQPAMFVLTASTSAKRSRVEGRVCRSVRARIDEQKQLELLKSKTTVAAPAPIRKVAMMDPGFKEKSNVAAHRSAAKLASAAQAKILPVNVGVKRPKLDKEGIEKVLFQCFEREKHWHFKDLVRETKQSAPKLKEALNDIAEKVKQGRFKDMYQLRRDLQDVSDGQPGE